MNNTTTRGRGFTGAGIISGLAIAGVVGAMGANHLDIQRLQQTANGTVIRVAVA